MATIRKRGDSWRAEVRMQGVHRSKSFPSKAAARSWATQQEHEIRAGAAGVLSRITFGEALARYAAEISPAHRGARWEQIRLAMIGRHAIAEYRMEALTPSALAGWRDERLRSVTGATVAREMNLLASVLEIARREWGLITVNPIRDVAKPPRPRARQRIWIDEEIERQCAALGYDDADPVVTRQQIIAVVFLLALETGMRLGELVTLGWDQVDLPRHTVRLLKTKNGDTRDVPLSMRAVDLLRKMAGHPSPLPVSRDVASVLFCRARQAAGIEGADFHDSRATAITRLAKKLDVLDLARMVGHRDIRSLMVYYRESAENIAKKL